MLSCARRELGGFAMRVGTRIALVTGLIGAAAIGSTAIVNAQYYYLPGYGPPPPYGYGYGNGWRTWNGCPPGYGARRRLSALSRSRRRRMAHLERLSAPLYDPGWRMQAVSRLLGQ